MLMAMSGAAPFDMPRSQIGGNNMLSQFGIGLGQLGPHRSASEPTLKETPPGLPKFPPSDFSKPPVLEGFPVAMPYLQTTEMGPALATSGGSILTQSANYMIVTPGILTSESQYSPSNSSEATPLAPQATDNLLPIGTERAHKSTSSLPGGSAFPVITPGINPSNVWSYSGNPTSEDSDWSKAGDSTDWPSLALTTSTGSDIINPGGDIIITSQDNLKSVLEKLGLIKFHPLFQSNEIDLDALLLMSEKDFSEIGLPKAPRIKLLNAIGRKPSESGEASPVEDEDSLATDPPSEGMASQGSNPDDGQVLLPQPDASQ